MNIDFQYVHKTQQDGAVWNDRLYIRTEISIFRSECSPMSFRQSSGSFVSSITAADLQTNSESYSKLQGTCFDLQFK